MNVNWDDDIPYINGKIKLMATKPPTRGVLHFKTNPTQYGNSFILIIHFCQVGGGDRRGCDGGDWPCGKGIAGRLSWRRQHQESSIIGMSSVAKKSAEYNTSFCIFVTIELDQQ